MRPYLVYTYPWDNASAGNIVLHRLAKALSDRFPTHVFSLTKDQGGMSIPSIEECVVRRTKCIAIYPEVIHGNPFDCGKIVRYLLNVPGVIGGPSSFPSTDILFTQCQFFNRKIGLPKERLLTTPCLDPSFFYDMNLPRSGRFFYRGKGKADDKLPGVPEIGPGSKFRGEEGQKELRLLLNTCELLYSYDCASAMYEIARLCGCPVVIMPGDSYTKGDCESLFTWEIGGIGYGVEEESLAISSYDRSKVVRFYEEWNLLFQKQLDNFINITQGV